MRSRRRVRASHANLWVCRCWSSWSCSRTTSCRTCALWPPAGRPGTVHAIKFAGHARSLRGDAALFHPAAAAADSQSNFSAFIAALEGRPGARWVIHQVISLRPICSPFLRSIPAYVLWLRLLPHVPHIFHCSQLLIACNVETVLRRVSLLWNCGVTFVVGNESSRLVLSIYINSNNWDIVPNSLAVIPSNFHIYRSILSQFS